MKPLYQNTENDSLFTSANADRRPAPSGRLFARYGFLATGVFSASVCLAQLTPILTADAFPTTDQVKWTDIKPEISNPFNTTELSRDFTIETPGGGAVEFSKPSGEFVRIDAGGAFGFPTDRYNFHVGEAVLWTTGPSGPVTIVPSKLVSGIGFNIDSYYKVFLRCTSQRLMPQAHCSELS